MSENFNGGPDGPRHIYNWNDIRRDVDDETPKEIDFKDVYKEANIRADLQKIANIKRRNGIKGEFGISDSRVQEFATAQEIGEMDWFQEERQRESLFNDDRGEWTKVFLSSEFDDFCNHVDAVGIMCNADSDFRAVPFALDMTYNTTDEKLSEKFGWRHPKLGETGLATVKYFEDTFSTVPAIEKGRIFALPRFVIGFSPELSHEITELRMTSDGWGSLRRDELTTKAKWCVLRELKEQSEQMVTKLGARQNEPEFRKLYADVKSLDKYFDDAIKSASEADASHPDWISYPDRDEVFQAITGRRIMQAA